MEEELPEEWVKSVVSVLTSGITQKDILITVRALQDWDSLTGAFPYELIETLRNNISKRPFGRLVRAKTVWEDLPLRKQGEGEDYFGAPSAKR
jgi:hypothetical protein